MKVIVVRCGKEPVVENLENKLEAMQKLVGGYIQEVFPWNDNVVLVCNEEGKLIGLRPNRVLTDENGKAYDIVYGTFFLCYAPPSSANFKSLPDKLIPKYLAKFALQ